MADYDAGFKTVARRVGRQLARLAKVSCQQWTPIVSEVQAVERFADRAFRARQGREQFVVYMEAYTRWDKSVPWDILAKSSLLSERERLPTVSLVFILLRRGYRPQQGRLRLTVGGKTTQRVNFREICLWKLRPEKWWEDFPALMPLYPLCRHRRRPREAIAHAAAAIEQGEPDSVVRADLLTFLGIFGKLAYPLIDTMTIIGREKMKESTFYQEILDEGRAEGRLKTSRAYILDALEARFGREAAAEYQSSLSAIVDPDKLDQMFRMAVRCSGLAEFRRALSTLLKSR
jgi:hypothetical protein